MTNIAIVTGASSGFGREFSKQLALKYKKLDEIWVIARRTALLEDLAEEISMCKVRVLPYDITDQDHMEQIKALLEAENPTVRVLVNNAGYGLMGHFEDIDLNSQIGMIDLNCMALTKMTHYVIPYMKAKSQIIQVSSSAAFLPQPSFAIYAATKAYVYSFSRALAQELKQKKISVTAVCPGPATTEFFDIASITGHSNVVKEMFMVKPADVVQLAIKDAYKGKELSVYSLPMKAVRVIARIIPTRFILPFIK